MPLESEFGTRSISINRSLKDILKKANTFLIMGAAISFDTMLP